MVFLIEQVHTPETCPIDVGGSGFKTLYDPKVKGVKLKAIYGNFCQHIAYYVIEADDVRAVNEFLKPGWFRCTSTVTPVSEVEVDK